MKPIHMVINTIVISVLVAIMLNLFIVKAYEANTQNNERRLAKVHVCEKQFSGSELTLCLALVK